MTLGEIKRVLEIKKLYPLKRFGQNFLHDQNLCRWIVQKAQISSQEVVWEIGPGLGALTEWILPLAKKLEVIEVDRGFISYLKEKWGHNKKFQLHEGDALELIPKLILSRTSCVIGNLPYSITTPLLISFLEKEIPPQRMIFTVQYEVAQRLLAQPKEREYGAVTVMLNLAYEIKLLKKISPSVFYPQPEVSSAVIQLIRKQNIVSLDWRKTFSTWVRQAFGQKRKQLLNVLNQKFPLKNWVNFFREKKWSTKTRAEELSLEQWKDLFSFYQQNFDEDNNL